MQPLISIIIPVYNAENYISKCLDSITSQTYQTIEVICINDGSTDRSKKILEKYEEKDHRIKIINKNNEGVSSARNTGIKNATGEYILFIDADDILESSALDKSIKIILEIPSIDVVLFDYINVFKKTTFPIQRIKNFVSKNNLNICELKDYPEISYLTNSIWHQLFKKDFLNKHSILFNESLTHSEDLLFWLLVLLNNAKIYLLPENLYYYNRTVENSASGKAEQGIMSAILALNHLIEFDEYKKHTKLVQKTLVATFLLTILNDWYLINNKFRYDKELNELLKKHRYPIFFRHFNLYKGAYFLRYRYAYLIIKKIVMKIITLKRLKRQFN